MGSDSTDLDEMIRSSLKKVDRCVKKWMLNTLIWMDLKIMYGP